MPKALPGFSGGTWPGRSKVEEGREEEEENMENEVIKEILAGKKMMQLGVVSLGMLYQ